MIETTDESFEADVLRAERPVLALFTATWCGPCKALKPVLESLSKDVTVVAIDVDVSPTVTARYGVRGTPTILAFSGGEVRARHLGVTNRQRLLEMAQT